MGTTGVGTSEPRLAGCSASRKNGSAKRLTGTFPKTVRVLLRPTRPVRTLELLRRRLALSVWVLEVAEADEDETMASSRTEHKSVLGKRSQRHDERHPAVEAEGSAAARRFPLRPPRYPSASRAEHQIVVRPGAEKGGLSAAPLGGETDSCGVGLRAAASRLLVPEASVAGPHRDRTPQTRSLRPQGRGVFATRNDGRVYPATRGSGDE